MKYNPSRPYEDSWWPMGLVRGPPKLYHQPYLVAAPLPPRGRRLSLSSLPGLKNQRDKKLTDVLESAHVCCQCLPLQFGALKLVALAYQAATG